MTTVRGLALVLEFSPCVEFERIVDRMSSVWGFDFGFGDFFGDLGGTGELGTVPAAA